MAEVEYRGMHEENGLYVCDKCGNTEFELVGHLDGRKCYTYHYSCTRCGAIVSVTYQRNEDTVWYGWPKFPDEEEE